MRLWSLHPSLLDRAGLVALWREGLLAQKVLQGQTVGYRFHPQLQRFRESPEPVMAIAAYLCAVHEEAGARGYHFDGAKIALTRQLPRIAVTHGQVAFEREHLKEKLRSRAPERLADLLKPRVRLHPLFRLVPGGVAPWEKR